MPSPISSAATPAVVEASLPTASAAKPKVTVKPQASGAKTSASNEVRRYAIQNSARTPTTVPTTFSVTSCQISDSSESAMT